MSLQINRIGIMGGTFDPVHFGHLIIAEEARIRFNLDKVVFVPAARPAHKTECVIEDTEHRYAMTVIATASNPFFTCSRIEIDRPGLSYALDTVKWFRQQYPRSAVYFITGVDAILEVLTWYKHGELKDLCRFIAANRPGYSMSDLETTLPPEYLERIDLLQTPGVDISGTEIRRRIAAGETIRYLMPADVEAYIMKHGLYAEGGQDCSE